MDCYDHIYFSFCETVETAILELPAATKHALYSQHKVTPTWERDIRQRPGDADEPRNARLCDDLITALTAHRLLTGSDAHQEPGGRIVIKATPTPGSLKGFPSGIVRADDFVWCGLAGITSVHTTTGWNANGQPLNPTAVWVAPVEWRLDRYSYSRTVDALKELYRYRARADG